jgi:hypothetical protein
MFKTCTAGLFWAKCFPQNKCTNIKAVTIREGNTTSSPALLWRQRSSARQFSEDYITLACFVDNIMKYWMRCMGSMTHEQV